MAGFFIRPKDTTLNSDSSINASSIEPSNEGFEDEYTSQTGTAVHRRRHPSAATEAAPNAPLPTGGRSAGISSQGVRGWRGPASKTVPSGFGRGTRAGRTGVRR